MSDDEEWRAVIGFEGSYEVSSTGRIRSIKPSKGNHGKPRILKPGYGGQRIPYKRIALHAGNGKRVGKYIHVMVCESFNGPRPGPEWHACHEDDDYLNNWASNLMWRPYLDNILKANTRRWSPLDVLVPDQPEEECPF
jgi:hypothetical protein